MRMRLILSWAFVCLICTAGCGFPGSGPSAKVKEFVNLSAKRDSDTESKLKLMGEGDEAAAREHNRRILSGNVDLVAIVGEGVKSIDILKETINDKSATVETSILGVTYPKPFVFRFQLQNESGGWKIVEWKLVDNSR